ncbi:hypothetical protein H7992_16015 [Sporosarcina sp. resist]|uniref:pPIWI-associating nuclease domain-containing protein n=1 Tax=unclassified Sporosarcina TaxID=2647733 RepID=UPI00164EC9D7|nr:hypothetical protein [Sporosarcina sp. resist]QNK86739.1 hypothetical protein H7992_16015 [Sporosarcina sp. resist]
MRCAKQDYAVLKIRNVSKNIEHSTIISTFIKRCIVTVILLLANIAGIVDVEHQYGSNRDFRNGDGIRMSMSHPFNIELQIDVITPLEIDIEIDDIKVDNSSFYDE